MRLRDAEASGPLQLRRLASCALAHEGATAGPYEGTLRGTDPLACDTLRVFWDASRDRVAAWAAFACPDADSLYALRDFAVHAMGGGAGAAAAAAAASPATPEGRIVEVGAGTGYWVALLRRSFPALDVRARDVRPPALLAQRPVAGQVGVRRNPALTVFTAGPASSSSSSSSSSLLPPPSSFAHFPS
jgi:hypothetical protein